MDYTTYCEAEVTSLPGINHPPVCSYHNIQPRRFCNFSIHFINQPLPQKSETTVQSRLFFCFVQNSSFCNRKNKQISNYHRVIYLLLSSQGKILIPNVQLFLSLSAFTSHSRRCDFKINEIILLMGQEADRKFAMNVDRCDPLWNAVTLTKQSRLCLMNILCLHFVRNLSKRVVEIRTNNSV